MLSCQNLKYPLQLPSSLLFLVLQNVNSETNLPCLSILQNLQELEYKEWSKNNGYEGLGLEDLHSLQELKVEDCSCDLMEGLHLPQNLVTLGICDCEFLRKPPDLSSLENLKDLTLTNCKMLDEIPGLGKLKWLADLLIRDCHSLERVENLSELERLEGLEIINCEALKHIDGIDNSRLLNFHWGRSEVRSLNIQTEFHLPAWSQS